MAHLNYTIFYHLFHLFNDVLINIFTYKLQENEVTTDNIDKIFDEISKKLKLNDTFVLYIAGHGTIQDGKYQFIPYKIDEKISIDNIKQNLGKIANYTKILV